MLIQVNLVMNNFTGYNQTMLPADLADSSGGLHVQFPQVFPFSCFVEVTGKFSGHDFTHEKSTVTKPVPFSKGICNSMKKNSIAFLAS